MSKNLKLSYILYFVFASILVAWNTLSNFFGGMALNFVAIVGIVFTVMIFSFADREMFKSIKDIFIISCVFCVLEIVMYFACEFGYGETLKGFIVYQNIISFFGLMFLAYVGFRFATTMSNKKIKFIEVMLGNEKRTPKAKNAKEISNGSLEEKPNHKIADVVTDEPMQHTKEINETQITTSNQEEEIEIIISEDEE